MGRKRLLYELGALKFKVQNFKRSLKTESFAVFDKIILYITIFFKIFFKGNVQKMSVEGASDFRVTNNNFLP